MPALSRPRSSVFGRRPTASEQMRAVDLGRRRPGRRRRRDVASPRREARMHSGARCECRCPSPPRICRTAGRERPHPRARSGAGLPRPASPRCRSGDTSARTRGRCSFRRRSPDARGRKSTLRMSCWSGRRPRRCPASSGTIARPPTLTNMLLGLDRVCRPDRDPVPSAKRAMSAHRPCSLGMPREPALDALASS